MNTLITPSKLAKTVETRESFHLQAYDWNEQTRNMPTPLGGSHQGGTAQTFNSKGQPADTKSDMVDQ